MIISFAWKQRQHIDQHAKVFDVRTLTHNVQSKAFKDKVAEIRSYAEAHPTEIIAIGCKQGKNRSPELARQVAAALRRSVFHK